MRITPRAMPEAFGHEQREMLFDELEHELRRFVEEYLWQPEWLWSPYTVRLMRVVRPKLEVLDALRRERVTPGRGQYEGRLHTPNSR